MKSRTIVRLFYCLTNLLEISFQTRELRDICQTQAIAENTLGNDVAATLRKRVADLMAAESYLDLPLGNPRLIYKDGNECLILDLCLGRYLEFIPGYHNAPIDHSGEVNWSQVFRVKLMKIGQKNDSH
ncbi:killer suppression protein [Vibrio parahaemolyticus]|nr:killer suppression protein [Vibrio parahaemolyticus]EGR3042040.1 killer suppression protein [Vibrio parahaemolyticus]